MMFHILAHTDPNHEPLDNVLFSIGNFDIYLYSVMILLGVLAALFLGIKEGKKLGIKSDYIIDGLIIILPLSIIGARLYYVIFQWEQYAGNFTRIFAVTEGGLAIHGGFLVAVVASIIYTRIRGLDPLKIFDLVAPGFLIGQAFGRWGNFFNQEAHGGVIGGVENGNALLSLDAQRAFLSDTLRIPDFIVDNMYFSADYGLNYYHPTFLYESLWNILGLIAILVLRRMPFVRSGDMIAFYLIWYSVGRFFIEFMRTDALFIGDTGIRTAQAIGIVMIVAGIIFLVINHTVLRSKHYLKIIEEEAIE